MSNTIKVSFAVLGAAMLLAVVSYGREAAPPRETRVLLGGDTHFGESYRLDPGKDNGRSAVERYGYEHSLQNLKPLLQRADFALLNLETPLSEETSNALSSKEYVHWTNPEKAAATLAGAGIDAVGLANNHSLDMGQPGLIKTFETLGRNRIAYFGAGKDIASARAPYIKDISLPNGKRVTLAIFGMFEERAKYRDEYQYYALNERAGVAAIDPARFRKEVAALRSRNSDIYVIAFPHWGQNYRWRNRRQAKLGHALIDAGADIVVGQHGHALQEVERYRGKWILYGIGNFLFNAPGRFGEYPDVLPFGLAVELAFRDAEPRNPEVRLYPMASNNRVTSYQPRPASSKEVESIIAAIKGRSGSKGFRAVARVEPAGSAIILEQ